MRTDPVSKNLHDDHTALNLAASGYTMLHTTGQALMDYTPLLVEINEVIPIAPGLT
jgi:hypothetical protein